MCRRRHNVDNDPLVLAHARALLTNTTPDGATAYLDADYHHPDLIITEARETLDFQQPVAVMFMGVLGYVVELDELRSIVARVMDTVPPGSYLVLWDGTNTGKEIRRSTAKLIEAGAVPYYLRSPEQLLQCFQSMELVDPGMVPITQWRPDATQLGQTKHIDAYGAIALKP